MLVLLGLFAAIVAFKFATNHARLRRILSLKELYCRHIQSGAGHDLLKERARIRRLLKEAGVGDGQVPFAQPIGWGRIATGSASVIDNLLKRDEAVVVQMHSMLTDAEGVFERRRNEALNPLYWLEALVFLPRVILSWLGIADETVSAKVLQLGYWTLTASGTLGLIFFREELVAWIVSTLGA